MIRPICCLLYQYICILCLFLPFRLRSQHCIEKRQIAKSTSIKWTSSFPDPDIAAVPNLVTGPCDNAPPYYFCCIEETQL